MYVIIQGDLLKSTDWGKSWTSTGLRLKNVAAVAVNPKQLGQVYAVSNDGMIVRSADGGVTWESLLERTDQRR